MIICIACCALVLLIASSGLMTCKSKMTNPVEAHKCMAPFGLTNSFLQVLCVGAIFATLFLR